MTVVVHRIYIAILTLIVLLTLVILIVHGYSYYQTPLEERFFTVDHQALKPSGIVGHGLGIIGSLCMLVGVAGYMSRKRFRSWSRMGRLKYWLEFHIFLCTLGPIMVLFHTAFKFGGLVAISFWSMVAVFASGIIGRFIYIQIPRTIEGKELSLSEIRSMKGDLGTTLKESYSLDDESSNQILETTKKRVGTYESNVFRMFFKNYADDRKKLKKVKAVLKKEGLDRAEYRKLKKLVKHELSLNRRIDRLVLMQNLFKYWHVAHLPFALVMLIIMIIHVGVTLTFGYRWIF